MQYRGNCDILLLSMWFFMERIGLQNKDRTERGFDMEVELKTVSFGGYDRKAVETFITEMQEDYEKQIAQLKETTVKLGETVDSLRKMREVNMNESKATVDNLRTTNTDLQEEVDTLRARLQHFEERDADYQAKYESVSKVALDAQLRADKLVRDTEAECELKMAQTQSEIDRMVNETNVQCESQREETENACAKLTSETEEACRNMKESTERECAGLRSSTEYDCANKKLATDTYCDNLRTSTEEAMSTLRAETEADCDAMRAQAQEECDEMKAKTRDEVYMTRSQVKRECKTIGEFVSQLMESLDKVTEAAKETKEMTDNAFGDLHSEE